MPPIILYLIGTPYCGSTILGAVFGQHADIENVGEMAYWTSKTKDPALRLCACGRNLRECEFWSPVRETWLNAAGLADESSYRALQLKYETTSPVFFLKRNSLMRRTDFQEYARLTRLLMESIGQVSGKRFVFDTTKSPGRAVALAASGLNVIPLHLIRSGPRFIVSSIQRRIKRRQSNNPNDLFYIVRASYRWLFTNLAAEVISSAIHPRSVRMKYEDLIQSPRETIIDAGEKIGVDLAAIAAQIAGGAQFGFDHSVDGSLVRLDGPTSLQPAPDKPLPIRIARIFGFIAGWLAKRYGY